ncbi:LysR family transcriptional regulator [Paracoccus sanguinis]|uniref:DNA-binding transcriptional regulator, LysR family n=1 Tax=Paracoccus sanguinis TaxID=1545044 RepID=A0A1H2RJU4_9RHOB|nr:LysR family transcriptional regulator [Paracoccus sanguinis]KGJ16574.1 LysR family transcriptional regulator [Paracoccus sanguinis]SDW19518.1 DNA-binding transcriptional regulator, LysR family [Paracoccus sanguinis]
MSYLESLRVFVRVVELGSITAGGRDMRLSPAASSARIRDLEERFGVRLLNRTTRTLTPTEIGRVLYDNARRVLATLDEAEAAVATASGTPQGVVRVVAPLVAGRRLVAPLVPRFVAENPEVQVRLRLSDRAVNMVEEGIDVAFYLGHPEESALIRRKIGPCPRVLVAAPAYLAARGTPTAPEDLKAHTCLLLRFPRSPEYYWVLDTPAGPVKLMVAGGFDTDDGSVLTDWALAGAGIANRPRYEVADDLAAGRLVELLPETPPLPVEFGVLTPHREFLDPKVRLFVDFAVKALKGAVA